MSDWPPNPTLDSGESGIISVASSLIGLNTTAPVSTAWPSTNLAIFVPVRVPYQVTVYKMTCGAGATAAGNFAIGLYDAGGNRLIHSGATVKGNAVEHVIDVTDTVIGPGLYYLAMAADGTNNYSMVTPSGTSPVPLQKARLYGIVQQASAYSAGLPATATFAQATFAPFPVIAAYTRRH